MNAEKIYTVLKQAMTDDERLNFILALCDFMPAVSPWYDLGLKLKELEGNV